MRLALTVRKVTQTTLPWHFAAGQPNAGNAQLRYN